MVIIGSVLYENPFFVPPDEFLRQLSTNPYYQNATTGLLSSARDLIGAFALPATWQSGDPKSIIDTLLDGLVALLRLEFAAARITVPPEGDPIYSYKASSPNRSIAPDALMRDLASRLTERGPIAIPHPFGEGLLRVISIPVGVQSRWGTVIAASPRDHFPAQSEMLLLTVASNQAALALEDAHARSLEADKLRLEAAKLRAEVELAHLRAQLEPHFLLNTLNAIAGLVISDQRAARRLIASLGDLLRDSLRNENELQTVDEQIEWLRRYAEILEIRYGSLLTFRWQIEADTGSLTMPRLLLQPLVENAVKHGALRRSTGGQVTVRTELASASDRRAPKLVCTVEDNGPGLPEVGMRSEGFGLDGVRRRLALRYGKEASLRLETSPSGTRAVVELAAPPL